MEPTMQNQEDKEKIELQLKELKILYEQSTKELLQVQWKNTKLQKEFAQLASAKELLSTENIQNVNLLKLREEEVKRLHHEITKQTKMRQAFQKKIQQMEDHKSEEDAKRETLNAQITTLTRQVESSQRQVEAEKKAMSELIREREILNKNMIKAAQSTEKQRDLVKLLEQDKKILEHEANGHHKEAQRQHKVIQQLEKERDHYMNEGRSLMQKVQQKKADIEKKEEEIFDWKTKLTEAECKFKRQESLLDSVVSERNQCSKNLIEIQEEIAEIERKKKSMDTQMVQLKDEVTSKELALAKDQKEYKRLVKNNKALNGELQLLKIQLDETKKCIDSQKTEQQKLQSDIAIANAEQTQQKKQMEQAITERDNLAKQLIHRNSERMQLYEKMKMQESILRMGSCHNNQQTEDIRLLKLEIKRLGCKECILDKALPNTEDLRQKVFQLERELLRERTRNSVHEELQNPINLHRWRQLEHTDPSKFKLIQKVLFLQKQLVDKNKELENLNSDYSKPSLGDTTDVS